MVPMVRIVFYIIYTNILVGERTGKTRQEQRQRVRTGRYGVLWVVIANG